MRALNASILLAATTILVGCKTVDALGDDVASVAQALDPTREYPVCGSYGMIDRNNDNYISASEWTAYRTGAYGAWDMDRNGRIDRNEFGSCWYGGGFYTGYDRNAWEVNWRAFDANRDGYLSRSEYYSADAWRRLDRNRDGRIDAREWRW